MRISALCTTLVLFDDFFLFCFQHAGQISIPENITFQLDTDPATDPPVFTLTCTSTGGPATTVIWKRNGTILRDDSNHNITSQVIDPVNITYTNTLTVTGRLAGQYECNVSNIRTSPSETRHIRVVGKEGNTLHFVEQIIKFKLFLTNRG